MDTTHNLEEICNQFQFQGDFEGLMPYGDGHINDTFLVTYLEDDKVLTRYIVQRVNHLIFKKTDELMTNIENITSYLSDMIVEQEQSEGYEVLTLIKTKDNKSYTMDSNGNYWRSYVFVEGATGHTFADKPEMLYEAGKAFGQFQKLLTDYPVSSLHETIVDFHHSVNRFKAFQKAVSKDALGRSAHCQSEIQFVLDHEEVTHLIIDGLASGEIPLRVTHNDTKINNVLLDDASGVGRCVIDLDTVMPGSALYDFGDAIRSCGSTALEDSEDLDNLNVDFARYEAYTKGFIEAIGECLTDKEYELLPLSAILMTLECGTRFLTDYLEGDHYFKVHKDQHNLIRARNQFKFVEEMEKHFEEMVAIVGRYQHRSTDNSSL